MPEKVEQGRAAEAYLLELETLLLTPGARERSETESGAILSATGFAMTLIVPTTVPVSVIEARPT